MTWLTLNLLLLIFQMGLLLLAGIIILRFHNSFVASISRAPQLQPVSQSSPQALPTIAVIIPAYNEAINIHDCVWSVLQSDLPQRQALQVWIADDESTDETGTIAKQLVAQDDRVHLISVPPRPPHERWMGKNWACTQAAAQVAEQTPSDYLLFIDADVRLEKGAIATALQEAQTHSADLLSCFPQVVCGCWAEKLAQPMMFRLLISGFNISAVNDSAQPDVAFAAGPFMLFRRTAYEQIGGHRAVGDNLVEDVALARRIKAAGLTMRLTLALDFIKVRMYQNLPALWEGWTKNLHMGARRKLSSTLLIALIAFSVLCVPWLGGISSLVLVLNQPWAALPCLFAGGLLTLELILWQRQSVLLKQPTSHWIWSGLGGGLVAAIAIASIIKTETGWGWTWRGRSLAKPKG